MRFNFSERQHPFSLTVSLLGGGGFFAIGIGSAGVQEIEAALEFGAAVSIDLGRRVRRSRDQGGRVLPLARGRAGQGARWSSRATFGCTASSRCSGSSPCRSPSTSSSRTSRTELGHIDRLGRGDAGRRGRGAVLQHDVSVKCRRSSPARSRTRSSSTSFRDAGGLGRVLRTPSRRRPRSMARQTILWTALPNGLHGRRPSACACRRSLSPRLDPRTSPKMLSRASSPTGTTGRSTLAKSTFLDQLRRPRPVTIDAAR